MKILLVDDDPKFLERFTRALSALGHGVATARGIARAKEIMWLRRPDVLITDFQLPIGSGVDLAEHVRRNYPEMKIVLMSLSGIELLRPITLDIGTVDALLEKSDFTERCPGLLRELEEAAALGR